MKGIILHGGHGTRLRPLNSYWSKTTTYPLQINRCHNIASKSIREAGITDIAIIIGGLGSNKVKEYYGDGENFGVNIYVY